MTTPLQHDYPDWARQYASADLRLLESSGPTPVGSTFGPYQVAGVPYLQINGISTSAIQQIWVNWLGDAAGTKILGSNYIISPSGGNAYATVPVRGPFVQFIVTTDINPADYRIVVDMVSRPGMDMRNDSSLNRLLASVGTSVGAGATLTLNATASRGGQIYWQGIFAGATAGRIELHFLDKLGNTIMLDVMGPGISNQGRIIYAPCAPLRLVAINNDASPRNLYATVLCQPYEQM